LGICRAANGVGRHFRARANKTKTIKLGMAVEILAIITYSAPF
jgi:hypothetical protein